MVTNSRIEAVERATGRTWVSEPKKDGTASLVVQHIGSATLERNVEAKEIWADITARFAAKL